jgi:hypothetical protein
MQQQVVIIQPKPDFTRKQTPGKEQILIQKAVNFSVRIAGAQEMTFFILFMTATWLPS